MENPQKRAHFPLKVWKTDLQCLDGPDYKTDYPTSFRDSFSYGARINSRFLKLSHNIVLYTEMHYKCLPDFPFFTSENEGDYSTNNQ